MYFWSNLSLKICDILQFLMIRLSRRVSHHFHGLLSLEPMGANDSVLLALSMIMLEWRSLAVFIKESVARFAQKRA